MPGAHAGILSLGLIGHDSRGAECERMQSVGNELCCILNVLQLTSDTSMILFCGYRVWVCQLPPERPMCQMPPERAIADAGRHQTAGPCG